MMLDGIDFLYAWHGRTLRHARRPVSLDPLRIVTRFRFWRQPLASLFRRASRAGP